MKFTIIEDEPVCLVPEQPSLLVMARDTLVAAFEPVRGRALTAEESDELWHLCEKIVPLLGSGIV